MMISVDREEDAVKCLNNVVETLFFFGFYLVSQVSNSRWVINSLPHDKLSMDETTVVLLVMTWIPHETFLGEPANTFPYRVNLPVQSCTRYGLPATYFPFMPVFSHLWICNLGQRILKKACNLKLNWGQLLPNKLKMTWISCLRHI